MMSLTLPSLSIHLAQSPTLPVESAQRVAPATVGKDCNTGFAQCFVWFLIVHYTTLEDERKDSSRPWWGI